MVRRSGLPGAWTTLATGVKNMTGRDLSLCAPPEAFQSDSQEIDVVLDGKLLGSFQFSWDDQDADDEVVSELRDRLSVFLDEELGCEDW